MSGKKRCVTLPPHTFRSNTRLGIGRLLLPGGERSACRQELCTVGHSKRSMTNRRSVTLAALTGSPLVDAVLSQPGFTVDTTVAQTFEVTAQHSTSNAGLTLI
jgi:hypothetical protein